MKKLLVVICCSLTMTILNAQETLFTKIDSYLTEGVANGFSGSILIQADDQIILNKGYGLANKERSIKNEINTVFDIGSNTKQFTSAAIMRLEEKGLLNVEDSLAMFFDNLPKEKRQITIHQLLTHTSGLQESIGGDFDLIPEDQFIEEVLNSNLVFAPGSSFNYSNIGYSLLAKIIEETSGQSYESFVKEQFFDPIGMRQTGYQLPEWDVNNLAHGYNRNIMHQGTMISRYQEQGEVSWHLKGNGGLQSTNMDLLNWLREINSGAILSPQSIEKWTTPYVKEINNYYAYGWGVYDPQQRENVIYHNGGNGAFSNTIIWDMDTNDMIIFSCNSSSPSLEQVPYEIEKMMISPNYIPQPIKKNPYYFLQSFMSINDPDQDHQMLETLKREYQQAISSSSLLNRMGYLTLRQGNKDWAYKLFKLNTELFPDDGNVWDSLGEYYIMSEQIDEAKKCLIKAITIGTERSCDWCESSINKLKQLILN